MSALEGGFVESGVGDNMVGDGVELAALENRKRLCPDVLEGRLGGNTLVGKEFEYLPGFEQVGLNLAKPKNSAG